MNCWNGVIFKDLDFKWAAEPPKEVTALSEDGAGPEDPVATGVAVDTAARGAEVPRVVGIVVSARTLLLAYVRIIS